MKTLFMQVEDFVKGKPAKKRSKDWSKVRKKWLQKQPFCQVCGGKNKLQVHHIVPFHEDPSRELDETNFITLCDARKKGVACHLFFGHLGNYHQKNPSVEKDAVRYNRKLKVADMWFRKKG